MAEPTKIHRPRARVVRRRTNSCLLILLGIALACAVAGRILRSFRLSRGHFHSRTSQIPLPGNNNVADGEAPHDPAKAKTNAVLAMPPESALDPNPGEIEPTDIRQVLPAGIAPQGMVWVPPGSFSMGSRFARFDDARPIHRVELDGFWMDETPVTNQEFARFVMATGHPTTAERKPTAKELPDVPEDKRVAGAVVFTPPSKTVSLDDVSNWWTYVPGASWRHPEGPGSDLKGREKHPVVQVSWDDVNAYAKWAGKRLPTEAEWEYAARGGLTQMPYVWGKQFRPGGKYMSNTFQGSFPNRNTKLDGWERTSPVKSFSPNGFGLYDMAGNVWQWCSDWYRPDYYEHCQRRNPKGPSDSFDPSEPGIPKRVQRGGSFLCSDQYCSRYMPGGRGKGAADTGASHVGFRCVISGEAVASR